MSIVLLVGAVVLFVCVYYLFELGNRGDSVRRRDGRPPPPPSPSWSVPLLGHLPLLGMEPHKVATAWIPKYGPLITINFGSFPCIIISDLKLIKEAYANPAFLGRPNLQFSKDRSNNDGTRAEGIIFTSGRTWTEQRGFTHKRLKEIGGFGTRSMESIIMEQVTQLVSTLRGEVGHPISTHTRFNIPVVNSLWAIIAGTPFKHDDPAVLTVTKVLIDTMAEVSIFAMLPMFLPWLGHKWLPNWITCKSEFEKLYKPLQSFFTPYIDEHYETRVAGQPPRDFIDAYIDEIESTSDPGSSFHSSRARNGLLTTVMDLFVAGTETISTTLAWTCLLLASYPDVQEKVAREIRGVLGSDQPPSFQHRKSLPYVEAVIHEVMRYRTIIPLGVFHSTLEDVTLGGYAIPKDTMVYTNVEGVHNDPEIWGSDVSEFRPERWLKVNGEGTTEFVRREGFIPFSIGKRVCPGEQMARDELFLFTTSLLQVFRIGLDPNSARPALDPKLGGTTQGPKPHRLVFNIR